MKKKWYWLIAGMVGVIGITMIGERYINPLIGMITSKFGNRINPFSGNSEFHNGTDILATRGTPVKSPGNGTVSNVYYNSSGGKQLIIQHRDMMTGYAHLDQVLVVRGQKILKGSIIATVGSTGQTTGSHLHFTVKKQGVLVDPSLYFNFKS